MDSNHMKGVILLTTRMRRLALAVLAGVLLGLTGSAIANAQPQAAASSSADVGTGAQQQSLQVQMLDWWE